MRSVHDIVLALTIVLVTAGGVAAQGEHPHSFQEWSGSEWQTPAQDPGGNPDYSGDRVTSEGSGSDAYYVVWNDQTKVCRVKKNDPSLSQEEKDAFDEAISQQGGAEVEIGDHDPGEEGFQPGVEDVTHVPNSR